MNSAVQKNEFDPMRAPDWTFAQVMAWIMSRNLDDVTALSDEDRKSRGLPTGADAVDIQHIMDVTEADIDAVFHEIRRACMEGQLTARARSRWLMWEPVTMEEWMGARFEFSHFLEARVRSGPIVLEEIRFLRREVLAVWPTHSQAGEKLSKSPSDLTDTRPNLSSSGSYAVEIESKRGWHHRPPEKIAAAKNAILEKWPDGKLPMIKIVIADVKQGSGASETTIKKALRELRATVWSKSA
ncbi:MAG: hypothetical protein U1E62_11990 [Alsobacter sp.]